MRGNFFAIDAGSAGLKMKRFAATVATLAVGIAGGMIGSSFMTSAASSTGTCLPISKGGTGCDAAAVRDYLGLGATSGTLPVANGGTGATTPADARTNLGLGDIATKNILDLYPVGSIYITTTSTNPETFLGGSWSAFGQGRTLLGVGSIDTNTYTNYGTVASGQINRTVAEERGGELQHTLAVAEMPSHTHVQASHTHTFAGTAMATHNHTQNAHTHTFNMQGSATNNIYATGVEASGYGLPTTVNFVDRVLVWGPSASYNGANRFIINNATAANVAASAGTPAGTNSGTTASNQNTGGDGAHNNIQPYITVYFWKRGG